MQDFEFKLSEMFVGVISEVPILSNATQTDRINAVSIISDIRSCLYGIICAASASSVTGHSHPPLGQFEVILQLNVTCQQCLFSYRNLGFGRKGTNVRGRGVKVLG